MAVKTYVDPSAPPPAGTNSRLDLQTVDDVTIGIALLSSSGPNGLAIQLLDTTADTIDGTKLRLTTAGSLFGETGGIEIVLDEKS